MSFLWPVVQDSLSFPLEHRDFHTFLSLVFPPSGFSGRVQVGCRGKGKTSIIPALTCDSDSLGMMLEDFDFSSSADYYLTCNTFSGIKRQQDDLFSFHNLILDLDCHQQFQWDELNFQLDYLWNSLALYMAGSGIPLPTVKVHTGRGLQLWWTLHGISAKYRPSYEFVMDCFLGFFHLFLRTHPVSFVQKFWFVDEGASRNVAGYFRLPLTMNTKVNRLVTYEKVGESYDLLALCEQLSSITTEEKGLFRRGPEVVAVVHEVDSSACYRETVFHQDKNRDELFVRNRISFLEQLRYFRNGTLGVEERNNFCFMVYNTYVTVYGHERAFQWVRDFNLKFKEPLTSRELENVIVTAKKKGGYYYTNDRMFFFLHVSEEEKQLLLSSSGSSSAKKKKSEEVALKKEKRNDMIFQLYQEGQTMCQVAEHLGISERTVSIVLSKQRVKRSTQRHEEILSFYRQGKKIVEIASLCHCTRKTVERVLAEEKKKN